METMSVFSKVSFLPGRFVAWTTRTKIGCCLELIGVGVVGWILSLLRNSFIHEKDNNFIEHQIRLLWIGLAFQFLLGREPDIIADLLRSEDLCYRVLLAWGLDCCWFFPCVFGSFPCFGWLYCFFVV